MPWQSRNYKLKGYINHNQDKSDKYQIGNYNSHMNIPTNISPTNWHGYTVKKQINVITVILFPEHIRDKIFKQSVKVSYFHEMIEMVRSRAPHDQKII